MVKLREKELPKLTFWFVLKHPFFSLGLWMDKKVWPRKSEEKKWQELWDVHQQEVINARKVIHEHMFAEHMASSQLIALQEWKERRNLKCTVAALPTLSEVVNEKEQ